MALFIDGKFYCECGCGKEISPWASWAQGHWTKTEEGRERLSEQGTGVCWTAEECENLSKVRYQQYIDDPILADRISESNIGLIRSEEACRNISKGVLKVREEDPTINDRISEGLTGIIRSEEQIQHMCEAQQKSYREDPTIGDRISGSNFGRTQTDETRQHMSEAWRRLTPEEKKAKLKPLFEGHRRYSKPSKLESLLDEWLQEDYPGDWKYVGNYQVWIGNRNPDFINVNGKKAVIELYSYWHDPIEFPNRPSEEELADHYEKYGYDCLVVWVNTPDDLLYEWIITIKDWIIGLK